MQNCLKRVTVLNYITCFEFATDIRWRIPGDPGPAIPIGTPVQVHALPRPDWSIPDVHEANPGPIAWGSSLAGFGP